MAAHDTAYEDKPVSREPVHAYLSGHAHQGWQDTADEGGVSMTGLIEAFGLVLGRVDASIVGYTGDPLGLTPELLDPIIKIGRRVDAIRRRRGDK